MWFSLVLGWFMTRFVLALASWRVMTPIGLMLRLSGKDVLDEHIDKRTPSYWKKHDPPGDRRQYRKQF